MHALLLFLLVFAYASCVLAQWPYYYITHSVEYPTIYGHHYDLDDDFYNFYHWKK
ncbi:hypothetical protein X975_01484, partial [Stegodyphus mimosarum]